MCGSAPLRGCGWRDATPWHGGSTAAHPAGTFWYHPHHHGTVADQVFAGLVGALLVEGEADLPVTGDIVLLVTDTTLDGSGRLAPPSLMATMAGREGDLGLC